MNWKTICIFAACATALLAQAQLPPVVVLEIRTENWREYIFDTPDVTRLVTLPIAEPPARSQFTFMQGTGIADIVAVNGKPSKGLWTNLWTYMRYRLNPTPGQAIANATAGSPNTCNQVFSLPDGTPFGTLTDGGVTAHSVLGGAGIFFGARGRHVTAEVLGAVPETSVKEDPSLRRERGGGGYRSLYYIYPAFRPEVETGPQGPLLFHGADFSLVTPANPARPGELLIARAKGLGSTTPDLLPPGSRLFPGGDQIERVIAPVYVAVNKQDAEVVNALGWPGTYDTYRVDFRVPGGITAGTAVVQLTLAWIPGPEVAIPVQ